MRRRRRRGARPSRWRCSGARPPRPQPTRRRAAAPSPALREDPPAIDGDVVHKADLSVLDATADAKCVKRGVSSSEQGLKWVGKAT